MANFFNNAWQGAGNLLGKIKQVYNDTWYLLTHSMRNGGGYYGLASVLRLVSMGANSGAIVVSGLMGKKYVEVSVECWDSSDSSEENPNCVVDVAILTNQTALYQLAGFYILCLYIGQFCNAMADSMMDRGLQLTTAQVLSDYMDKVNNASLISHSVKKNGSGYSFPEVQQVLQPHISKITKEMFLLHASLLELSCLLAVISSTFSSRLAYTFIYVPVLPIVAFFINRHISEASVRMNKAYIEVAKQLQQDFDNIVSIKAFKGEQEEKSKLDVVILEMNKAKSNFLKTKAISDALRQFIFYGSLTIGGYFYVDETTKEDQPVTPNQLLSIINMLVLLSGPLSKSSGAFEGITEAESIVNTVLKFVRSGNVATRPSLPAVVENHVQFGDVASSISSSLKSSSTIDSRDDMVTLTLSKLGFSFEPNAPQRKLVLNDVNLTVSSGECIAIVGASGCGKSTIAKLIMGLYPVTSGSVKFHINGEAQPIDRDTMGKHGMMVLQNTDIFMRDIYYNISYPNLTSYTRELMDSVIDEVGLANLRLPQEAPAEAKVLYAGRLSGGERQRIGIARALLRKAKLYVFDELTAGLDPIVASTLIRDLSQVARNNNAAVVVITHNLETITAVDKVYFLGRNPAQQEGASRGGATILESGSYTELTDNKTSHFNGFLKAQRTSFTLKA